MRDMPKKRLSDRFSRLVFSIYFLRIARRIEDGKKTMDDVPEKYREGVNEAIKIIRKRK